MFKIYFARGYANEELVGQASTQEQAQKIADEAWESGMRDVTVEDQFEAVVYEPSEDFFVFDEF